MRVKRLTNCRAVHPVVRDLAVTTATQVIIFFSMLFVISLVGRLLGAALLGEYLLVRRVVSWLMSGILLGLGVALPRYVAHTVGHSDGAPEKYFAATLVSLSTIAGGLGLCLTLWQPFFARVLFGSDGMKHLLLPLSLLILGMAVHGAVYGYYRGILAMGVANALQCCNSALVPLLAVALLFAKHSVALIVDVMGLATLGTSLLFAAPLVRPLLSIDALELRQYAWDLLKYGVLRVPGDFAGSALFALGPVIATHYLPLSQVSYLLLGISMLTATSVSVSPLGQVLLSKVSMMLADNRLGAVQERLQHLLGAVLELSTFGCVQIVIFADSVIRLWVGSYYLERIGVVRAVVLTVPFYLFCVSLQSVIDAASVKPYNARNDLVALTVFLATAGVVVKTVPNRYLLNSLALTLLWSYIVLAYLTGATVRKLYGVRLKWKTFIPAAVTGFILTSATVAFRWIVDVGVGIAPVIIFESLIWIIFLSLLMWRRDESHWLRFLYKLAFVPSRTDDVLIHQ
jgi:O-antigen/teichoic acid export membrane protein